MKKKEWDVIVVGGGSAGIGASLAAARNGANTLLVERYGIVGGMGTVALVHTFDPILITEITGISREIYSELKKRKGLKEFPIRPQEFEMPYSFWEGHASWDPEIYQQIVLEEMGKTGVELLLHSLFTEVLKEENTIKGIMVENKSGRQEIHGRVIIDATGDADVAARAGVPFQKGDESGVCQSPTLCFRMGGVVMEQVYQYIERNPGECGYHPRLGRFIRNFRRSGIIQGFRKLITQARENGDLTIPTSEVGIGFGLMPREGEIHVNATRTNLIDGTKVKDLTRAEISERRNVQQMIEFMKKYIPGFQDSYLIATGAQIGIRETRRIRGGYFLTIDDIKQARTFDDAIMQAKWAHADIHSGTDMKWSFEFYEGPYQIPYRCLIPQEVENLMVVGRSISVDRKTLGGLRPQPQCMAMGQAAGTAAAISLDTSKSLRKLDVKYLQERLRKQEVHI